MKKTAIILMGAMLLPMMASAAPIIPGPSVRNCIPFNPSMGSMTNPPSSWQGQEVCQSDVATAVRLYNLENAVADLQAQTSALQAQVNRLQAQQGIQTATAAPVALSAGSDTRISALETRVSALEHVTSAIQDSLVYVVQLLTQAINLLKKHS